MTDPPLQPADPKKMIYGYAVYKIWKEDPKSLRVEEYFNTVEDAKAFIKQQKKSPLFEWGVGGYQ